MATLAILVAAFSTRYFFFARPLMEVPALTALIDDTPRRAAVLAITPYLLAHHKALLLGHIGCGIAAMTLGLLQFHRGLRASRPRLHRIAGRAYLAAVICGSACGLPLSFFIPDAVAPSMRPSLYLLASAFTTMSLIWPVPTIVAVVRARQRRFDAHRAWMMRSYALTFAAVTTRLVAPICVLVFRDPIVSATAALYSWPLNLLVAEMLIAGSASSIPGMQQRAM
jgi:uncharacterized membrane protein